VRWERANHGEIRTVIKFLWFPKEIDGQVRWLEKAKWKETNIGINNECWYPVNWVDPE
jgi:hypothetical protein